MKARFLFRLVGLLPVLVGLVAGSVSAEPATKAGKKQATTSKTKGMPYGAKPLARPTGRQGNGPFVPFETAQFTTPECHLDRLVLDGLRKKDIQPALPCSDVVFIRRIYLDLTGTVPELSEINAFLKDTRADKRSLLIDELLEREEFADYWSLKWSDLLRVKSEFPINLWPNAVQAYHRWIRDSIAAGKPYDQFVREMLTSSGSNFRVPPVNFYRGVQGQEPETLAAAVALNFMGSRIDSWPADRREGLIAMFSRVSFKPTAEWKEEIISNDPSIDEPLNATLPDGTQVRVGIGQDPRIAFADWLITKENQWFARAYVNRAWSWFFGRGIIHEADDIRTGNPPSNPALLAHLEHAFAATNYDPKVLFRLITNSRTYQQSSIPRSDHSDAESLFAFYPVRRIEAEVLIDALCRISGTSEVYMSPIPEPFTFIPASSKTITLADGSITSKFLEMFGRPPRDTGLEAERNNKPSDAQRLHMLNSTHIQQKIEQGWRLKQLANQNRKNPPLLARSLYMTILSRPPQPEELAAIRDYAQDAKVSSQQTAHDIIWALINSKEFLYRH